MPHTREYIVYGATHEAATPEGRILAKPTVTAVVVHRCDCGGQGQGIQIACDATWTEPAWAGPQWGADPHAGLPQGVHRADDGRLYTFDAEKVTCAGCGQKASAS